MLLNQDDAYFYHMISLNLISKFKNGDEYYVHDLLCNSIFNLNLWSHLSNTSSIITDNLNENENRNNLIKKFQNLKLLQESAAAEHGQSSVNTNLKQKQLRIASGHTVQALDSIVEIKNLDKSLYENLNQLKFSYLNSMFGSKQHKYNLERSNNLNNSNTNIETMYTSRFKEIYLFNTDWIYIPIMNIIQEIQQQKHENNGTKMLETVLNMLKFVYLCEMYRTDYMKQQIPFIIRLFNLLNVYLTSTDVYLDRNVSFFMYVLLIHYVNTREIEHIDFENVKVPGIISFYDYYKNLLRIFDSESFGDSLFAHYILLPIQQHYPLKYRFLLWSEYIHLFKFINFDDLNVEFLLSLSNFLTPFETNLNMLQLYSQALLNDYNYGLIKHSQIGYLIALKHVNTYLFDQVLLMNNENEINFKKFLFKQFYNHQNEVYLCVYEKIYLKFTN